MTFNGSEGFYGYLDAEAEKAGWTPYFDVSDDGIRSFASYDHPDRKYDVTIHEGPGYLRLGFGKTGGMQSIMPFREGDYERAVDAIRNWPWSFLK